MKNNTWIWLIAGAGLLLLAKHNSNSGPVYKPDPNTGSSGPHPDADVIDQYNTGGVVVPMDPSGRGANPRYDTQTPQMAGRAGMNYAVRQGIENRRRAFNDY